VKSVLSSNYLRNGMGDLRRPVFPYPSKTVYKGTGDPNDKNSFKESKRF
jgi:hypothetical protein